MTGDRVHVPNQMAFDIEDMIRQAELDGAGEWTGAPLGYTTDYYTPTDLQDALDRYRLEHGNRFAARSHMWFPALCSSDVRVPGHVVTFLQADTRIGDCGHDHASDAAWPDALVYQANCVSCRWRSIDGWNQVVEAAHDHSMPGWRQLPIMPTKLAAKLSMPTTQSKQAALDWIHDNYPPQWLNLPAPIRTVRTRYGTRTVEGRSPLGGYDIAVIE